MPSTANPGAAGSKVCVARHAPQPASEPYLHSPVQATEEAIVNAMVAAKTMKGINDFEVLGLPHDRLREC